MRTVLLPVVFAFCCTLFAQETRPTPSTWEVFGGVNFVRTDTGDPITVRTQGMSESLGLDNANSWGWRASTSQYVNRWFGATAEVNGVYAQTTRFDQLSNGNGVLLQGKGKVGLKSYSFLFGPTVRFTRKSSRIQPFANVLIGAVHTVVNEARFTVTDASGAVVEDGLVPRSDDTAFAWAIGGGADIPITRSFAIRTSAEYLRTSFQDLNDDRQNHIRVFGGLVWRWYRD